MYDKNHYNIVISLQLIKKKKLKIKKKKKDVLTVTNIIGLKK